MDMIKLEKLGIETSRLGFGCMRFPIGEDGEIDEVKASTMLDRAYEAGITYYDTAYVYHNQKSEGFMAKCLSKYPRDSYTIATKLPAMLVQSLEDAKRIFEDQLVRLNTNHVDFYLLHGMNINAFNMFVEKGILAYCEEMKAAGKIKYFGFSFHDVYDSFETIIKYRDWDFCQIQLNYVDINEQAGLKGYHLAEQLNIPLMIMEPIKGGSLSILPEEIEKEFRAVNQSDSLSTLALRWVGSYMNNKVILSGMTTMEQLEENIKTFSGLKPLSEEEFNAVDVMRKKIREKVNNGCTGCNYCMPCPVGVDIPKNFSVWNRYSMFNNEPDIVFFWTVLMQDHEKAKNCIKCGQCEDECPQGIGIRDDLAALQKELDKLAGII